MSTRRPLFRALLDTARLTGVALWRGFTSFYRSDNMTYAASIAYYSLLSMFPFALLAVALVGRVTADGADREAVLGFVLRYFPAQFDFITRQLDAFRESPISMGVAGTVTLVWGALGFFGAISSAVNHAWRVEKTRSYWTHKLFSFLMLLVAGALLVAAVLLVGAAQVVESSSFAQVLSQFPGLLVLRSFALRNATTAMFILVVGLVFYFVPNTRVRFRDVWIGAFLTGGLWKSALMGLGYYMRDMERFTRVNGSISAVVVFLVWVYVQAVILLYGVEFTAAYARLRRERTATLTAAATPNA